MCFGGHNRTYKGRHLKKIQVMLFRLERLQGKRRWKERTREVG